MSKELSTLIDTCTTDQLRDLLKLATSGVEHRGDLPDHVGKIAGMRRVLNEMCGRRLESGDLLLDSVAARNTSLDVLRGIKEFAKQLVSIATSAAQRDAATLLYHAAEAAAYGYHGVNISTRSMATRWPVYEQLAGALREDPMGTVFQDALDKRDATPVR